MSELTSILNELSPIKRVPYYQQLATRVLDSYPFAFGAPEFLQHNSGITYRVPMRGTHQCFLLKIHDSIGDGAAQSATHIDARMVWLAAFGQVAPFALQEPVPNRDGTLVTMVVFSGLAHPVPCKLQQWVPGEHPTGDFTLPQIEAVGAMLATLHAHRPGTEFIGATCRRTMQTIYAERSHSFVLRLHSTCSQPTSIIDLSRRAI